VNSRNDL